MLRKSNSILVLIAATLFGFCANAQTEPPAQVTQPAAVAAPMMAPPPAAPQNAAPAANAPANTVPPTGGIIQAPTSYYYYCDASHAYYPAVASCANGWVAVPVAAPPPLPFQPRDLRSTPSKESEENLQSKPSTVNIELFGRALAYSLNFDRAINERLTLGIGVSSWDVSDWWDNYDATVTVVPVYGNYYFKQSYERGFLTLGLDWVSVTHSWDNNTFTNNGIAGVVGGGYESRDPGGFFYRLGAYLIAGHSVDFSPSVVFGVAF